MANRPQQLIQALLVISAVFFTACGSNNNDSNVVPTYGSGGIYGTGGCAGISAPIGFQGQGIYVDSSNIIGGQLPGGQTAGQIRVGTGSGGAAGPSQIQGSDGYLSMNIQLAGGSGYGTIQQTANVTGNLQLSSIVQQQIAMQFGYGGFSGYGYGQGSGYPQTTGACVSGLALNLGHQNLQLYPGSGTVYVYLNGTSHGYVLYF